MAIKVKEIIKSVDIYTYGNDSKVNATKIFKKLAKEKSNNIQEILKNDSATSTELIKSLDELVYAILDYRYNIVDYLHYTDDEDNGKAHLRVSK